MPEASATTASWARILVVRGDAPRRLLFEADKPACLVVGSDPSAGLCIAASEVAPRQCDVAWDGAHLWLQDALRLGRTFVNGQLLNEWLAVVGQAVVSFGPIRLWMVTNGPYPISRAPDFTALERARLTQTHHDAYARCNETGRITLPPELREQLADGRPRG